MKEIPNVSITFFIATRGLFPWQNYPLPLLNVHKYFGTEKEQTILLYQADGNKKVSPIPVIQYNTMTSPIQWHYRLILITGSILLKFIQSLNQITATVKTPNETKTLSCTTHFIWIKTMF